MNRKANVIIEERKKGTVRVCPECERPREEWPNPNGFTEENVTYCCPGCAEGTGCTCTHMSLS